MGKIKQIFKKTPSLHSTKLTNGETVINILNVILSTNEAINTKSAIKVNVKRFKQAQNR